MVTYLDPFVPLAKEYPFSVISQSPDATYKLQDQKHRIEVGWLRCPCSPVIDDEHAWKREVYQYRKGDIVNNILYLHQTPIMVNMWQVKEGMSAFIGQIMDSCGKLHKTAMVTFNQFLSNSTKIEYFRAPYQVITRKLLNPDKTKTKKYYLYHLTSQEEWLFKDGICIEPVDRFLDWLNI